MNHLEEAKRIASEPYTRSDAAMLQLKDISEKDFLATISHALIAIAEELEKIHKPSEQKYYDGLSDGNEIERLK